MNCGFALASVTLSTLSMEEISQVRNQLAPHSLPISFTNLLAS